MGQVIHLAKTLYIQHTMEVFAVMLLCGILLMIISLLAIRRCRKQIREQSEKTKELIKLIFRQTERQRIRQENEESVGRMNKTGQSRRNVSSEDEELFGDMIREIFSS